MSKYDKNQKSSIVVSALAAKKDELFLGSAFDRNATVGAKNASTVLTSRADWPIKALERASAILNMQYSCKTNVPMRLADG